MTDSYVVQREARRRVQSAVWLVFVVAGSISVGIRSGFVLAAAIVGVAPVLVASVNVSMWLRMLGEASRRKSGASPVWQARMPRMYVRVLEGLGPEHGDDRVEYRGRLMRDGSDWRWEPNAPTAKNLGVEAVTWPGTAPCTQRNVWGLWKQSVVTFDCGQLGDVSLFLHDLAPFPA